MSASDILKSNPLMKHAIVSYSYTQEYGSDGCWHGTEHSKCTLGEWVNGIGHRHPGNRSYNFELTSIEEVNTLVLNQRADAEEKKKEENARKAFAASVERKAKEDAFKATINAWVGKTVTVKKNTGTVERAMESRFDKGKIALLVRYTDGSKKWHSEGAVKNV